MAACRRQLGMTDSELFLRGGRPELSIEEIHDARRVAYLVSSMRVNEHDERVCFDAALGLLRATLAWSLIPCLKDAAQLAWDLIKDTLVDGVSAGNWEIRIADGYWSHISAALTDRFSAILRATGRIHPAQRYDAWPPSLSITLLWPLIEVITDPERCEEGEVKDVFEAFDGDSGRSAWLERNRLVVVRDQYVLARASRAKVGRGKAKSGGSAVASLFRS